MARIQYRRLRQNPHVRDLCTEVRLSHRQLIQPHFVVEGLSSRESIPGLTDVHRETGQSLLKQVASDLENGVSKIILFGVPKDKSSHSFQYDFTAEQVATLKKEFGPDLFVAVDVCLCSYTDHGQCGVLNTEGNHVENTRTVSELTQAALAYAQAGADCVAPSDMMDGRIGAIRNLLDQHDSQNLDRTLIMSYSAKFHSKFYGPFRVAADSAPKGEVQLKDRATYQIDPARPHDAYASSKRDLEEGADILMVKPGMPYLDILADLSQRLEAPWAVYQVSGEFASIELMSREGLMSREAAHLEAWTAFARAGASMIITYGARHAKKWIPL